jgi:hypothetical protein
MSDEQETRLETALQRAADHPQETAGVLPTLMASSHVLGTSGGEAVDDHVDLKAGDHISYHWVPDGTTVIPVFSLFVALQRAIEVESKYLKLPAGVFSK